MPCLFGLLTARRATSDRRARSPREKIIRTVAAAAVAVAVGDGEYRFFEKWIVKTYRMPSVARENVWVGARQKLSGRSRASVNDVTENSVTLLFDYTSILFVR